MTGGPCYQRSAPGSPAHTHTSKEATTMPSITRRKFLAATGATAGAMATQGLFPAVLRAQIGRASCRERV